MKKFASTEKALRISNLEKEYGNKPILKGIELQIPHHQCTALLGASGSGKSTLLRLIVGLEKATKGNITLLGTTLNGISRKDLQSLRQRFALLFQDGALFASLSVEENIAFPMKYLAQMAHSEIQDRVSTLLKQVGLKDFHTQMPQTLSGGQRKRVALARALALNPEILFLDEPTSGLDPRSSAAIDDLILATKELHKMCIVVITHDIQSAYKIADHAAFILDGKIHKFADMKTLKSDSDPNLRAFLDRKS